MNRFEEALRRLESAKRVVLDVETSGLDWKRNHIVGYVLSFDGSETGSYYLPLRHAGGGNIPGVDVPQTKDGWQHTLHRLEPELVRLLDRPDLTIVGHFLGFDLKFLWQIGLRFKAKYEDTHLNAVLINEFQASFSLDACSRAMNVVSKKTDIYDYLIAVFPEAKAQPKSAMGHFWRLAGDNPWAYEYARGDGRTTWQLAEAQQPELDRQDLRRVQAVENRVIPVLARMTCHGVRIDEEQLHRVKATVEQRRDEALRALPEGFNPRSPIQVKKLMVDSGCTDWPLTDKGAASFPENWLEHNEVGKHIVRVRKYSNLLNSFIEPMIKTHLWNGRVHPSYNQLRGDDFGTITGRLSSSDPNLQQCSKRNKELGKLHRSIFVADDGMTWCSSDLSQCEPRLLAYYSRSKVLLEGYRQDPPLDAHTAVAQAAGIDRDAGKRMNQALISGAAKKKLTATWGIDPDQVEIIWAKYFESMPEIRTLQRRASTVMQQRGYVLSLLGRKSRLSSPDKSYVAINRLLQLGNADWIKASMALIDDYLQANNCGVQVLNQVHDSLDFQFHPDDRKHLDECLRLMVEVEPLIKIDVPMAVDSGYGTNWAEATYE